MCSYKKTLYSTSQSSDSQVDDYIYNLRKDYEKNQESSINKHLSSKHHRFIFEDQATKNIPLIETLQISLPHIHHSSWHNRLYLGGVHVNGIPQYEDATLSPPCIIDYFEPDYSIDNPYEHFPAFSESWIQYLDEYLVICYKPQKLPTLSTKEQRFYNLKSYLETYFKKKLHFPSRLDTSTAGLIIASINSSCDKPLQQLFEKHHITKTYFLHADGIPSWNNMHVDTFIVKDSAHPILRKVVTSDNVTLEQKDAKRAVTDFLFLRSFDDNTSLLEAKPKTGRTHQIRVHAQHLGHAIVGDKFYWDRYTNQNNFKYTQLRLLSYSLQCMHPMKEFPIYCHVPDRLLPEWAYR
jgi:RluA family pseudouridine synthase